MTTRVSIEHEAWTALPDAEACTVAAVNAVIEGKPGTVDILLTSDADIRVLNRNYRKQDKATNVLSFPASPMPVPPGEIEHLGDIVLAYETVAREAQEQGKRLAHHVTHLIVHATLHLMGHDHKDKADANAMERREIEILARLGIADPYA
jgi:probable rRNA maturation factor